MTTVSKVPLPITGNGKLKKVTILFPAEAEIESLWLSNRALAGSALAVAIKLVPRDLAKRLMASYGQGD